ncbi:MAG: Fic family protein [Candidatus Aenigmarchaeota archaeon]|nr:Fic family protein [Candidatus Aenigmarchaeota archaeon]
MRILKRKNYYYLQHSFRKEGKVLTREKYIGKKIPKTIESIKLNFLEECHKEHLFKLFEKIKRKYSKQWQKYPQSIKEKIKEQIAVDFTYNTNAIEGSTITLNETRQIIEDKIAPNKHLGDIKETESHANVFLEMQTETEKLDVSLILKWHRNLFLQTKPDIAGRFRNYLVRVGNYNTPDWQDVEKLMKELIEFYKKNDKMNTVELASRMHYRFEKIHPFGDGNGRVGRLIMNYILIINNYPVLMIKYTKRQFYYNALQKDENRFFNYFAKRYLKMYMKYACD